jgi:hypothetical protein
MKTLTPAERLIVAADCQSRKTLRCRHANHRGNSYGYYVKSWKVLISLAPVALAAGAFSLY